MERAVAYYESAGELFDGRRRPARTRDPARQPGRRVRGARGLRARAVDGARGPRAAGTSRRRGHRRDHELQPGEPRGAHRRHRGRRHSPGALGDRFAQPRLRGGDGVRPRDRCRARRRPGAATRTRACSRVRSSRCSGRSASALRPPEAGRHERVVAAVREKLDPEPLLAEGRSRSLESAVELALDVAASSAGTPRDRG